MTSCIIIVVTLHDNSCERKMKPELSCSCVAGELDTGVVEVLFCRTLHQITFMHQEQKGRCLRMQVGVNR